MKKDPTQFRERFKRWKEGEQVYEAGLPKYEDGTFPDSFYKKLYDDKRDRNTPDVDYYQEAYDYSEKEALDYEKFLYSRYPDDYSVYGGLLPGVTVKPDPNSMSTVRLYTYYPVTSRFPFTGHSELSTEGGNVIDVRSDDPEYNLVFNNCSDATRRALQLASGKKLKYNLFTTPGDVRDFAESLGGKTHKHKNGYTTTTLQLPTKDVRNIAKYSKYLLEKRDDEYWKEYNKFWNAVSNARDLKRNNKYFKNMPINTKTISNVHKFIFRYEDGKLPRYEDGITPYQKYIDATEDQQNGRYLQQGPWNNPIVLFFDPTGVSGYPQVKEAFDNGNTYDKAVSILGAIPLLGKLKPAAKAGSVVNIPNDVKSYLDWDDYYRSIIYKDNKNGSIGPRKYIGSADYHEFKSLIRKGEIRKATPTEIQWWYDWTGGDSASPGLPLGSAILQPFENYKRLQKILLLKDKNFNGRWFKKHENGKLPKYADGLTPYNKRDVNTNQALYNSEEDLYSPRYTLPEVTVTGTNKRPLIKNKKEKRPYWVSPKGAGNMTVMPRDPEMVFFAPIAAGAAITAAPAIGSVLGNTMTGINAAGDAVAATAAGQRLTSGLNFAGNAIKSSKAWPWVDAGLTSAFASHGLNHTINEGIDGLGDAAMTALEVAPLGGLARPIYKEVVQPGMRLFNSPLTGNWIRIGNREYRLSPNSLGANGSPIESRKIEEYSTGIDLNKVRSIFEDYEKGLTRYKGSKPLSIPKYNYELPKIDFDNLVKDDFVEYLSQQTGRKIKRVSIKDTKHGDIYNEGFAFVDDEGKELAHIAGIRKGRKNVWVESSYVDPEFRYKGLGKQMYFDLNDHVFNTYGTTLHSDPMQRVGSTGVGMSPSNRLWKNLRDNGMSTVEGEGFNRYDIMAEPSKITTAYRTPVAPQITAENAASITPAQWTAAQDAAIARGDMAEAQRLRDLHFKVSAPNTKILDENGNPLRLYHGTNAKFNSFDETLYGTTDGGMYGTGVYTTPYKGYAEQYGDNIMNLYANIKNPVDARSLSVDDLMLGKLEEGNNIFRWTDIGGKRDGVLGKNQYLPTKYPYEVISHKPNNIKSADAVTFDNNGVRIPLGKRDNFKIKDIRYGLIPLLLTGSAYNYYNQ